MLQSFNKSISLKSYNFIIIIFMKEGEIRAWEQGLDYKGVMVAKCLFFNGKLINSILFLFLPPCFDCGYKVNGNFTPPHPLFTQHISPHSELCLFSVYIVELFILPNKINKFFF